MRIITILSGKGGTGKTTLSSNLSVLLSKERRIVVADCDADAPNLGLALGIKEKEFKNWENVQTNEKAVLDENKCRGCKKCVEVCNFGAISWDNVKNKPLFNSMLCEGCGACQLVCNKNAINLVKIDNGRIGSLKTRYGFSLVSGQLDIGSTGSGKVVNLIKEKAKKIGQIENSEILLLDSAAGVGCPVIASIQGSDFIIAVTEPTPSGLSDLKRALKTIKHFRIPCGLVINKWDLNKEFNEKIEKFAQRYKIPLLGKIPYDKSFVNALVSLKPIVEINSKYQEIFNEIILQIKKAFKDGRKTSPNKEN
jgi:MinD superfamily P-loop ATPase